MTGMPPVPGTPPAVPAIVRHYAGYLRVKARLTPEIDMSDGKAVLTIGRGGSILTLVFACRKDKWGLSRIEVKRGGKTSSFTQGELATAIASLPGHEPQTPDKPAAAGPSGPRTDAALRGKRTTVIRI